MVLRGLKDGMKTQHLIVDDYSGNTMALGRTISSAEIIQLTQSGTYSTGGAAKYTGFAASFSNTPIVVLTPTQAFGANHPLVVDAAGSGFNASGAAAHTGNYIAFGMA